MNLKRAHATVVIISSIPWNFTWQRHNDIAVGLAERGYRVIYVEPFPKRWPRLSEWRRALSRLAGSKSLLRGLEHHVPQGIQIISPKTLPEPKGSLWTWTQEFNKLIIIPKLIKNLRSAIADPVIVINYLPTPISLSLHSELRPAFSIYDAVVDWDTHWSSRGSRLVERDLVRLADVVLVDSPYLYNKMVAMGGGSKVKRFLPAVHFDDFKEARRIKPFQGTEIVCGYFGSVTTDLHLQLLLCAADRCKLRLIGPIERGMLHSLSRHPNIEIHHPRPYPALVDMLKEIDVFLLPYKPEIPSMKAVMPAKTFQCLATGKPTIVFGLEALREYSDVFYIAETEEQFCDIISSLPSDWPQRRQKALNLAQQQDWRTRIDYLESMWKGVIK